MRRKLRAAEVSTSELPTAGTQTASRSPDTNAESVDVASRLVVSTIPLRVRVSSDRRYLTIGQVRERFGVSDMWVWRHMRTHGFPRPIQFGGPTSARHWRLTDIEQWEHSKAVAS